MSIKRVSLTFLLAFVIGAIFIAPDTITAHAYSATARPYYTTSAPDYWDSATLQEVYDVIEAKFNTDYPNQSMPDKLTLLIDNGEAYNGGSLLFFLSDHVSPQIYINSNKYPCISENDNSCPFFDGYYGTINLDASTNKYTTCQSLDPNPFMQIAWARAYGIVTNYEVDFSTYYPTNTCDLQFPPTVISNIGYETFEPMLISYLSDYGFGVSEAHLRDSTGESTLQLPIVTDASDLEADYEGLYIIRYPDDFVYHFKIALTTGSDPNAYSEFWDDYLTFTFTCGTSTEFNIVYGVEHPLPTSEALSMTPTLTTGVNLFKPYLVNQHALNVHTYSTSMTDGSTVTSSGDELIFGQLWRYTVVSPVSRIEIPDLYFAINFKNVSNGTDTTGINSTNYDNSTTNYYDNKYNMAIQGMTGTISGSTSFSADYSRDMPDTTIDYNDTVTFDDAGLGSFFLRVWSVGNGFFTNILLAVLAVAFVAYLIYGRS